MLIEEHRLWTSQLKTVTKVLEEAIQQKEYVDELLDSKGIGTVTISKFITEVGDIRRFKSPKQEEHKQHPTMDKQNEGI